MIDATHWEKLRAMAPEEVARRAMAEYDERAGEYVLRVLADELRISPESKTVRWGAPPPGGKPPGFQYWLVSVVYLISAREQAAAGDWLPATSLPYGEFFFRGPHALPTAAVADAFGTQPEEFDSAARRLGGTPWPAGRHAFIMPALPRVPILVQLWEQDEEFPARATFLFDRTASAHLAVDALWSLAIILSQRFAALK